MLETDVKRSEAAACFALREEEEQDAKVSAKPAGGRISHARAHTHACGKTLEGAAKSKKRPDLFQQLVRVGGRTLGLCECGQSRVGWVGRGRPNDGFQSAEREPQSDALSALFTSCLTVAPYYRASTTNPAGRSRRRLRAGSLGR